MITTQSIDIPDDILPIDIDYFVNLFVLIDDINVLPDIDDLHAQLSNFLPIMSSKSPSIQKESIYYLRRALSECVYVQSSLIYRFILKHIYNVDYSNFSDNQIEMSALDDLIHPIYVFGKNPEEKEYSSLDELFNDEIITKREMKPIGDFFDKYQSRYDFNSKLSKEIFVTICEEKFNISKYDSLLLIFPEYYQIINKTVKDIFSDDTINMKQAEKYYLGIIGASTVECEFVIKDLIRNYILNYGDENWITQGVLASTEEMKKYAKLFGLIAYQPWKLKVVDLIALGIQKNIERFIQAVIIMTTFQRIAAIAESAKINVLCPDKINKMTTEAKNNENITSPSKSNCVNKIYNELKKTENSKERRQREEQLQWIKALKEKTPSSSSNNFKNVKQTQYTKFKSSFYSKYIDFDYKSYEYLFSTDFSFENTAYYLLVDYWASPVKDIADDFDYIFNLTSNCFGSNEKVPSTEYFRRVIVTLVERIYGMCDETFDYSKTNSSITKELRKFVKNVACSPECVDFSNINRNDFSAEDQFHIILLSSIAKQRLQLTYVAKVVNELLSKHR